MLILLTGGSGSGKSVYAEDLCLKLPAPHYYVAALQTEGDGGAEKIAYNRRLHSEQGFITIERPRDLAGLVLSARGTALLECICHLTANEMFAADGRYHDPVDKVLAGVEELARQCTHLLVVTNDVGSDGAYAAADEATQAYVRALGQINAALAEQADAVYELVCGIPVQMKGGAAK